MQKLICLVMTLLPACALAQDLPSIFAQTYYLDSKMSTEGCDLQVNPQSTQVQKRLQVTVVPDMPVFFEDNAGQIWQDNEDCMNQVQSDVTNARAKTTLTANFWRSCGSQSTARQQIYVINEQEQSILWIVTDIMDQSKIIECVWRR